MNKTYSFMVTLTPKKYTKDEVERTFISAQADIDGMVLNLNGNFNTYTYQQVYNLLCAMDKGKK